MLDKLNNILCSHYLCITYTPHRHRNRDTLPHTHRQTVRLLQEKQATIATPAKPRKPETETCIVHAICTNVTVCVGQENFKRAKGKGEQCVALYGLKHGCNS